MQRIWMELLPRPDQKRPAGRCVRFICQVAPSSHTAHRSFVTISVRGNVESSARKGAAEIPDLEDSTRLGAKHRQGSQTGVSAGVLQHRLAQSGGKGAVGFYRLRSAPQATHVGMYTIMCCSLQQSLNQSRLEAYRHASRFSRLIRRLSVRRQRVRVRSTVMNPVLPASAHAFTSSPEARSHERLETVERNDDKPMYDWGGLGDGLLEAPALRTMTKFNQLHRCGKVVMPRI